MIENIIALLLTLILVPFAMTLLYALLEDEIKGFLNKHKGTLKDIHKLLTPKTPIQKEIEAERKEITELKQHKRDMEELEELKKQKDQLWEEVHEEEYSTFKGIDPLPHLKNLQRNEFSADDIRYKDTENKRKHFEEMIREALKDVGYSKLEATKIDTPKISINHINQEDK